MNIPDSFSPGETVIAANGQRAHPLNLEHGSRLEQRMYKVGTSAWSYVGNGLSNQSFIEGPEGLIVIDTGECVEEMADALKAVREHTAAPVVACFYTHFHYVAGTTALLREYDGDELPIYGHRGIDANLRRFGGEVGPRGSRGLVHQFAVMMPPTGADGLVHVGLGRFFRNPAHAPFTNGHLPATITFDTRTEFTVAGLEVHFIPAPSDATDSVTIWFPELKLAVNNLLWPALFNVFAIRGEEYRDPRILLNGLDEMHALGAEYLIGAHGPPIEGRSLIEERTIRYRDSIQFMWDQTVRGANLGLTLDELIAFVQLPEHFRDDYVTQQLYGVVEHHVRQIYCGLFGWFDEDEAKLFPTPAPERSQKLIAGFGGTAKVREAIDRAMTEADYRWALELCTWLVRSEVNELGRADAGAPEDRQRLADVLREIAYCTTSSNIRNWCLTRALELDGTLDLSRFRQHRFRAADVAGSSLGQSLSTLRVLLLPGIAKGYEAELVVTLDDGERAGLQIRNQVAVPTSGEAAGIQLAIKRDQWAALVGGKTTLSDLIAAGDAHCAPNHEAVTRFCRCFDHPCLSG